MGGTKVEREEWKEWMEFNGPSCAGKKSRWLMGGAEFNGQMDH